MTGSRPPSTASDATCSGDALIVGGREDVQLALSRLLGRASRVSLLRWQRARSAADASRYCARSIWLGDVDAGVARWRARLEALLAECPSATLVPADSLAHALVCDGSVILPPGVEVLGPSPEAWARGGDRLRAFELARATGWHVPQWKHVVLPDPVEDGALPCVVRPRRDVLFFDDEPARFSTKRIADLNALEAKLRDDVPRGEVLLQALPHHPVAVCGIARAGVLVSFWAPRDVPSSDVAALRAATEKFVAAMRWTGLLDMDCAVGAEGPTLFDIRCGGGDALVRAAGAGESPVTLQLMAGASVASIPAWTVPRPALLDPAPSLAAIRMSLLNLLVKVSLRLRAWLWPWTGGRRVPPRLTRSSSILFVCKGNINRSVVAEQLLRCSGYAKVASAALLGLSGRRPSMAAERFLTGTLGLTTVNMVSQSVRRALERSGPFDVVLCFERRHAVELTDCYPDLRGRIHLLTSLAAAPHGPLDIADPYGQSEAEHRRCFARIRHVLHSATVGDDAGLGP
jgi:protein-tyrosine-phosphatase